MASTTDTIWLNERRNAPDSSPASTSESATVIRPMRVKTASWLSIICLRLTSGTETRKISPFCRATAA